MATEYTNKEKEGEFLIYRNEAHVATFSPESNHVGFTPGNDKYAPPVGREVARIQTALAEESKGGASTPVELPEMVIDPTPTPPPVSPKPKVDPRDAKISKLEQFIQSQTIEIAELKTQLRGETVQRVPERYKGINLNDPDSPVKDPALGDLTPAYVKWAREGGYTKEQFAQAYKGRKI